MYQSGEYVEKNPTYHVEDSSWKAEQIVRMMKQNQLQPRTVCEVGCGAGEILRQLQTQLPADTEFYASASLDLPGVAPAMHPRPFD